MKKTNLINIFLAFIFLVSCGGSNPSISVLPSTDSYTQDGNEIIAKMDILWVVDNSGSMNDFQVQIEQNFIAFMQNFSQKDYDYQMAVTKTDAWRDLNFPSYTFNSSNYSRFEPANDGTRILTGETPDVLNKFKEMVLVGTSGTGDERALQSIQAARLNPNNASFFRPDAHLAIIIVSDEEDTSWSSSNYITADAGCPNPPHDSSGYLKPGCISAAQSVSYYKDFLDTNTNAELGATVHNMAILEGDNACRTSDASYQRYYGIRTSELSTLTGGTLSSLCGNFASSLDNIAKVIIERTVEFKLTDIPANPNALVVSIKAPGAADYVTLSQSETNGWKYKASNNSIVFSGDAIPPQGSLVNIYYDPDGL